MKDRQEYQTTIPTRTHAILQDMVKTALGAGRMGIARGAAGIGKSYALALIEDDLSKGEDEVLVITANASTCGALKRFFSGAILNLGIIGHGAVDPMERLQRYLLQSYPFRGHGPRKVLVIDECQHLKANVIESLRAVYDQGYDARNFDPALPAFGMVLVGNDHFLTRGGKAERNAFEAILTRSVEWEFDRPERDEIADLAAKLCPDQADLQEELVTFGMSCRNFRQPAEAVAIARHLAGEAPLALVHMRRAILMMGGK